MSTNEPLGNESDRGSIVLVSSTSGYFGTTGNAAYIASKHGTVGLLRASQAKASSLRIRVNSVAPSYTPTYITAGFGDGPRDAGLEVNTPEMMGSAIAYAAVDPERRGTCCLVCLTKLRLGRSKIQVEQKTDRRLSFRSLASSCESWSLRKSHSSTIGSARTWLAPWPSLGSSLQRQEGTSCRRVQR